MNEIPLPALDEESRLRLAGTDWKSVRGATRYSFSGTTKACGDRASSFNQSTSAGIPVCGIILPLIKSFGDKRTERLFDDKVVKEFQGVAARAKRKLESVNAASRLEDLLVPPSNRLEKLRGNWKEFHSIRINDQWRIVFRWSENHAHDVAIVDYH